MGTMTRASPTRTDGSAWPVAQLREVAVFRSGCRNSDTAVEDGAFPFFVCASTVLRCTEFDFDDDAIVMAGNNADAVFHLHRVQGKFAARQRTYVITPATVRLDCEYLFHQLQVLQRQFQAAAIGTTTRYVTIEMLRAAEIPLPELQVQHAIAEALGDADALLAGLNRLIAKKCDLKLAAMQLLLTGRTRLPGFQGEWEVRRLGDLFEITSSRRVFQREWKSRGVPFYRARELAVLGETGRVDNDLFISESHYKYLRSSSGVPEIGDMLVTGVGTLGKTYVVTDEREFYFKDGNIIWFKIRGRLWPEFLRQLFLTERAMRQIADAAAGTTVGTYTIAAAKRTQIPFPGLPEQAAIAEVLSDMDAELGALEARREKTRALKQAMMQELLTGRTRLV
jgi:type I restriction enzyme S subunit